MITVTVVFIMTVSDVALVEIGLNKFLSVHILMTNRVINLPAVSSGS